MLVGEKSPFHSLSRILANKRRKRVRTPVNVNYNYGVIGWLKQVRWLFLLRAGIVILKVCALLRTQLPTNSIFRPHNLIRFRPHKAVYNITCTFTPHQHKNAPE